MISDFMAVTIPGLKERMGVPAASSAYATLGIAYTRAAYPIEFSNSLVMTGGNYYDSRASIPSGQRMSTAAEELAIQLGLEKAGQDTRKAKVFDDLFARNESKTYIWQWTVTGLRVPKGRKADVYETDKQGRKYWIRELLEGDKAVAEILVPEGNGRVVVEWDEVSGLPRVTDNIAFPHKPYTTHFWFNEATAKDNISGHYDVAVGRCSDWRRDEDEGCLDVGAGYGRWGADFDGGFRPVRGSAAEIKKTTTKIITLSTSEMENDYGKLPFAEFAAKYNL